MLFRQLFDAESSTYTYLIADSKTRRAVLIDPVLEQVERDLKLLEELSLTLVQVFETHVHADHITGAGKLRERTGCKVYASENGASCADGHVRDGDTVRVDGLEFRVLATPGHTDDSVSYLLGDRVFTGDALLVRSVGRTDFQNGDAAALYHSVTERLFTLPDDTLVYPGHDYKGHQVTTIGEEKRHNARVANRALPDFVALMKGLNLPPPKKLDIAVPANRLCGMPQVQAAWRRFRDVSFTQLSLLPPGTRRIDVREPEEYDGPLGHLPGTELVPLAGLGQAAKGWTREAPILLICRSGNRSGQGAQVLVEQGFTQVFNLQGGMLAVRESETSLQAPV